MLVARRQQLEGAQPRQLGETLEAVRGQGVGRDDELQLLLDAVSAASEGRPAVVLLGGDAGVGKTRLLAQVVADAPVGTTVLRGGCVDLGDVGLPYLPFVEVFADLAQLLPEGLR